MIVCDADFERETNNGSAEGEDCVGRSGELDVIVHSFPPGLDLASNASSTGIFATF